jgi:hypothetical protein
MKKHSNKEIRKVIKDAVSKGWIIKESSGQAHIWGSLYCPNNDPNCCSGTNCILNVHSTPKNPQNHAKQLERAIKKCIYYEEKK